MYVGRFQSLRNPTLYAVEISFWDPGKTRSSKLLACHTNRIKVGDSSDEEALSRCNGGCNRDENRDENNLISSRHLRGIM